MKIDCCIVKENNTDVKMTEWVDNDTNEVDNKWKSQKITEWT
jgi:hypothetical protein